MDNLFVAITGTDYKSALSGILETNKKTDILQDYELLREKLGGKGASENAAEVILNM